jgi:hypothetical protein
VGKLGMILLFGIVENGCEKWKRLVALLDEFLRFDILKGGE